MRITRAKSYEDKEGNWNKFEIELSEEDLLPVELDANPAVHFTLLEIKAEQCLNGFLLRVGEIDEDTATKTSQTLEEFRQSLLKIPTLKSMKNVDKS